MGNNPLWAGIGNPVLPTKSSVLLFTENVFVINPTTTISDSVALKNVFPFSFINYLGGIDCPISMITSQRKPRRNPILFNFRNNCLIQTNNRANVVYNGGGFTVIPHSDVGTKIIKTLMTFMFVIKRFFLSGLNSHIYISPLHQSMIAELIPQNFSLEETDNNEKASKQDEPPIFRRFIISVCFVVIGIFLISRSDILDWRYRFASRWLGWCGCFFVFLGMFVFWLTGFRCTWGWLL